MNNTEDGCMLQVFGNENRAHLQERLGDDFDRKKIECILVSFEQFYQEMGVLEETMNLSDCSSPLTTQENEKLTLIFNKLWSSVHEILGADDFKKAFDASLAETLEIGKFLASGNKG